MSKSRGVFQILGDDVTRAMSKGGGVLVGYLCKISGKSTPLPPLTKAFFSSARYNPTEGGAGSDQVCMGHLHTSCTQLI